MNSNERLEDFYKKLSAYAKSTNDEDDKDIIFKFDQELKKIFKFGIDDYVVLVDEIRKAGSHKGLAVFKGNSDYIDIVKDVAKTLKVALDKDIDMNNEIEIERAIFKNLEKYATEENAKKENDLVSDINKETNKNVNNAVQQVVTRKVASIVSGYVVRFIATQLAKKLTTEVAKKVLVKVIGLAPGIGWGLVGLDLLNDILSPSQKKIIPTICFNAIIRDQYSYLLEEK